MSRRKQSRSRGERETFAQQVGRLRSAAAEAIWNKARIASGLRHLSKDVGNRSQATRLGAMKERLLREAVRLAPHEIQVTIDSVHQVGLVSVCWPGHGRLHLPATTDLAINNPKSDAMAAAG